MLGILTKLEYVLPLGCGRGRPRSQCKPRARESRARCAGHRAECYGARRRTRL